jgi:Skp family chaperone for outer membrane proteins
MIKKLIIFTTLFLFYFSNSFADNSYFIDFSKVLNNSNAGAKAQSDLKKKFTSESNKFGKQEADLKKTETEIISQKKTLTKEEYQKKVESLRVKVANLQKNKQDSFKNLANSRNVAKQALLKSVTPIIKKYMEDNNIRMIVDKKSVILGDSTLEITDKIIVILNKELISLK